SPERKRLLASDSNAVYSPATDGRGGYLLFALSGAILAQKFDPDTVELSGDPFRISDRVRVNFNGRAFISVSGNGTLAYDENTELDEARQLTWYDRAGNATETVGKPAAMVRFRLSPDERLVA